MLFNVYTDYANNLAYPIFLCFSFLTTVDLETFSVLAAFVVLSKSV